MSLERLQRLAQAMFPARRWLWLGACVCVALFFYAVLQPASGNRIAQPAYLVGIWLAVLLSFIYGFRQVPPPITKPWWRRWLRNAYRAGYWLLAGLSAAASLGLIALTFRLLMQVSAA